MTFQELGLVEPILKALDDMGYVIPTPIQKDAIPHILANKDVLGSAQTGTGKTAAFALPLIQSLILNGSDGTIKVLIVTPTRELAIQIRDNFRTYMKYTNFKCSVVVGGVNQGPQVELLRKGVDVLIATPGRLLDLIEQRHVKLHNVQTVVLDEADTMLDMGFLKDITKIITKVPFIHQTLLFSATMPSSIEKLAQQFLKSPVRVSVNPVSSTVDKVNQTLYYVDKHNKTNLLMDILSDSEVKSALVFTRTKHGANKLATTLIGKGLGVEVIHGNKSQNARMIALRNFKSGKSSVLIATDIAARGIDIAELSHVINYEIPNPAENYVHRIGRTGRAGLSGEAISFSDIDEKKDVADIEKLTDQKITVIEGHKYPMTKFELTPKKANGGFQKRSNSGGTSFGASTGGHSKSSNFNRSNNSFSRSASYSKRHAGKKGS